MQRAKEPVAVATAKPEDFSKEMQRAFDAIARRAFEIFAGDGYLIGRDDDNWFKAQEQLFHPVHVNIAESGDTLTLKAEVPGFTEKDLQVTVESGRLTISGKRETSKEETKGTTVYSETCSDEIFRVVDLPAEVDADKVTATLKDGMLQLTMPKIAKGKTIPIKSQAA